MCMYGYVYIYIYIYIYIYVHMYPYVGMCICMCAPSSENFVLLGNTLVLILAWCCHCGIATPLPEPMET